MEQKVHCIGPKIPNRPQERGKQGEKQHGSAKGAHQRKNAQLPLGPVQGEEKQRCGCPQAVDRVQHPGKLRQTKAEGAKQIMGHPDGQPQQN